MKIYVRMQLKNARKIARKKSSSFRVFLAFGFLIIESYPAQHKGARRSAHLAVLNQGRNKDKCAKSFAGVSRDMDRCAASTRRGSNGPWFNSRPCQTVISPSWFASRCSRSTRRQFIQVQKKKNKQKGGGAKKRLIRSRRRPRREVLVLDGGSNR